MRGVVAVALALLVSTVASGCFVEDKDPETQDTDTSSGTATRTSSSGPRSATTTTTGGNGTAGGNATNLAPTANLTASPGNGTAPLNVTFTIGGADPEGGNLTWTLTLDNTTIGNGTSVPANHTHAFTEAGNHTVVLTVSDGTHNATANVTVTVAAGAAGDGAAPREDAYVVFNADGTCDAKTERTAGPVHVQDRGGGSIWVYRESNSLPGLQVGTAAEQAAYRACQNPDTLIF